MIENNKLLTVIDLSAKLPYNAAMKEKKMTQKENRVGITKKREIVGEISRLFAEGEASVAEACKKFKIPEYTYYNWKKRVEQLDERKRKARTSTMIVRRPIVQSAPTGEGTGTSPSVEPPAQPPAPEEKQFQATSYVSIIVTNPESQKSATIQTDMGNMHNVLRELGL